MQVLSPAAQDSGIVQGPRIPALHDLHLPDIGIGLIAGVLIMSLVWLYLTRRNKPLLFRHLAPDGSLDTTTTTKVVGIVMSIVIVSGFCMAVVASAVVFLISGKILQPTPAWLDALESILFFLASMLGISALGTWAKRKTANAEVIDAQLRARTGVTAEIPAKAGATVHPSAAVAPLSGSANVAAHAVPTLPVGTSAPPRVPAPAAGDVDDVKIPERLDDGAYE